MPQNNNPINRIYRLTSAHAWMTDNEARALLMMIYASVTKSLEQESEDFNLFMEKSLEKMCEDTKENLQEYLLKIKDKFPNNELLSKD